MLEPSIAPVRPRVRSPATGEVLLLEEVIADLLDERRRGVVALLGGPGSGKTTALRHLAAVLPERDDSPDGWGLFERLDTLGLQQTGETGLAICSCGDRPPAILCTAQLPLVPWGRDELIEYLLEVHPRMCRSVMERIGDVAWLGGSPLLWRIVLDALAEDEELPHPRAALERHLDGLFPTLLARGRARRFCLEALYDAKRAEESLDVWRMDAGPGQVLRQRPVLNILAAEELLEQLHLDPKLGCLTFPYQHDVIRDVGRELVIEDRIRSRLERILLSKRDRDKQSTAVTLLHASDPAWRPKALAPAVNFRFAWLEHVNWPGVHLRGADLSHAAFNHARLEGAQMDKANLNSTGFVEANLRRASLVGVAGTCAAFLFAKLHQADLTGAKFIGACFEDAFLDGCRARGVSLIRANLTRTSFRDADLTEAQLNGATLEETDFTGAKLMEAHLQSADLRTCTLTGACLDRANLAYANLEDLEWPDARLAGAVLAEAHLTGSVMPRADLRRASLVRTGLGEIDWEGADLRDADLTGATFHMGSTRSGLLFTPYAGEGSKTGFYTDEYHDQHYKSPEEIRKANLRGADLRGARLENVDFYLVDLRGARLDPGQFEHVRKCGAILTDEC
jgi:uncharacterized protein YjbI with pentapeptide repeats